MICITDVLMYVIIGTMSVTVLLLMMYKFMFKFIINIIGYPVDILSYRQVLHITKCIVEIHMQ